MRNDWLFKAVPWFIGGVLLLMIVALIAGVYAFATMDPKAVARDFGEIARAAKEGFDGK